MTNKFINSFSKIVAFLLVAALVMTFSPQRCLANMVPPLSGTLSEWEGGLTATDGWIATSSTADTTLAWEITNKGTYYEYKYTFTTASGAAQALSHFILEVSLGFDIKNNWDIINTGDYPLDLDEDNARDYENPDPPDPDEPGSFLETWDFFGIKFDTDGTDGDTVLKFNSKRVPEWGNFFAKDGVGYTPPGSDPGDPKVEAYAWNTLEDTVAVPDTSYIPVPGAVILGILGLGVAGLKLRKYA